MAYPTAGPPTLQAEQGARNVCASAALETWSAFCDRGTACTWASHIHQGQLLIAFDNAFMYSCNSLTSTSTHASGVGCLMHLQQHSPNTVFEIPRPGLFCWKVNHGWEFLKDLWWSARVKQFQIFWEWSSNFPLAFSTLKVRYDFMSRHNPSSSKWEL
jgi:hypothetical protein